MKFKTLLSCVLIAPLLSGCFGDDAIPDKKVNIKKFATSIRGFHIPTGIIVTKTSQPVWIQAAATGYSRAARAKPPAKIKNLKPSGRCDFTRPLQGDYVGHVFFVDAWRTTDVFNFSNENLHKSALQFLRLYKTRNRPVAMQRVKVAPAMKTIDVFVTETEKPVYLVLTTHSDVIWNIQKAKGVEISQIVLIGHRNLGVANIRPSTPVEVLHGETMKSCRLRPAREPASHWKLVKDAKGSSSIQQALEQNEQQAREFSSWLNETFGRQAIDGIVQANKASHALVGPVPENLEDRIAYKSLEGAVVSITRDDNVFVSEREEFRNKYKSMVEKLATKLAGGDLDAPR